MYDKTIANDFRIYPITIITTPTLVYDLLAGSSKTNYDEIVNDGLASKPAMVAKAKKNYKRDPIDGYIISENGSFNVLADGNHASETVAQDVQYTIPVYHWPKKTWVSVDAGTLSAVIRVFFN